MDAVGESPEGVRFSLFIKQTMSPKVSKIFRTIQVQFPGLQDAKFVVQKSYRRVFKKTHEVDFDLLTYFHTKHDDVFVDIGANRGDAIQSILIKKPNVRVVAFEPNELVANKILKEFGADDRVTVHNCGLGSVQASFNLFVPFYNNYMFDGLASFKRENAEDWLRKRLFNFKEEKLEIKEIVCKVDRLDNFGLAPKFLKIDVQGFEYEVLVGATETLKRHRPIILMEAPKEKELKFLQDLSYEPLIYKNEKLHRGSNNYNVFFFPTEKIHEVASVLAENPSKIGAEKV
jgi:FkbM family methyltransferase